MEANDASVMRSVAAVIAPALLLSASPAGATRVVAFDLPAGRFGDAVTALGHQAGASILVDDDALWSRPVAAVRGVMAVSKALRRLLAGSGDDAIMVATDAWRVRVRPARVRPRPAPITRSGAAAEPAAIVVSASKRDVPLTDFPGTAEILDGRTLVTDGPGDTDAVISHLATVTSTYLGAGRNKLFIRGIADSSFTGPTQATVGQYLGDLRLTYNAPDPDLRLYDVAEVEVLEGPQGALYGAGSLGGIIRITQAAPDTTRFGGAVSAGVSLVEHGEAGGDASAMLNVPLGQDRAVRLVGYRVIDGGYIDNVLTGHRDVNRTATTGGRGTLRVALDTGWTIDFGGALQTIHGDDSQYADAGAPRLTRASPVGEGFNAYFRLTQLVVSKAWDDIRLRSTTGYIRQSLTENYDATSPGGTPQLYRQDSETRLFSTEERVWKPTGARSGWLLGVSYTQNRARLDRALGPPSALGPITGVINIAREATAYGEASWRVAPWLTATAGGRASWTRIAGGALHVPPAELSPTQAAERARIIRSRDADAFLPSIALTARLTHTLAIFARYQQSFRPGGLTADHDFVRQFHSDRVATIETGLRLDRPGADGFELALSGSYTFWRNIQADFIDTAGLVSTTNIGDGRIWSAAASGVWHPDPHFRIEAAFTYNDGHVTNAVGVDPSSASTIARIPNVARLSARLGGVWEHDLTEHLLLRAEAWGRYVGRSRLGVGPVLGQSQGGYPESAATIRVGSARAGVSIGVTNLSDSVGNRFALGTPFAIGTRQITPLQPRTFRIGLDANF